MAAHRALNAAALAAGLAGVLGAAAGPARAAGCDCFSPELQLKTAQDALQQAQVAAVGRIVEVSPDGAAKLLVIESYKGPASGATIELAPRDAARCRDVAAPATGEMALVLAFGSPATGCDKYPAEHYMVDWFRQIGAKGAPPAPPQR